MTLGLPKTRGFKLAAINITSLPKYIDQLRAYMITKPIDILAVNETRLDDTIHDNEMCINGYVLERNDRNRNGGGVALYIRNTINYDCDNTLNLRELNLEWLCIKVKKPKTKPFLVATWYRPPNSPVSVMDTFECLLENLESQDIEINILGDLNCDVSATPVDHNTSRLLEICNTYQYKQLIEQPTRTTKNTATTIDLFLTNDSTIFSHYGTSDIAISDHNLIYAIRKLPSLKSSPKIILSRQYKNFDCGKFREDLALISWENIGNQNDPNSAWGVWKECFLSVCDYHAPLKRKKVRNKPAPWLTSDLKKLMFERDRLKKIANRLKTEKAFLDYRVIRNKVNENIKSSKIRYYNSYFNENRKNIKKAWRGVNDILGKNPKSTFINHINYDNKSCTSPREISSALNSHFTDIGPKLASQIPLSSRDFTEYINPTEHSFNISQVSNDKINELINALPLNKACGLDGISARLLKDAAPIIVPSLTFIINLSIRTGIFPDDWKIAKVTPIYKDEDKANPNNYRPISVLPVVTKLIERVIFDQLYSYLTGHNLLTESQSGFRPQHSTMTALLDAVNDWYSNIDRGLLNGIIFLDLKKAFDTMDHQILLHKLKLYGVCQSSLVWFTSYLKERKQSTFSNGVLSDSCAINCGIPQGSILGPLLFLVYINDLPSCDLFSKVRMYADDTSLTIASDNVHVLEQQMNHDMSEIHTWLQANKLSLNVVKTKYMIIASQHKIRHLTHQFQIEVNHQLLKREKGYKYLGVEIDDSLTWKDHICKISKKISGGIGALKRVRQLVPFKLLLTMYNSLVLPYFDYCSAVWGSCGRGFSDTLQKLQNRAARVVTFSSYNRQSTELLDELKWDNLEIRRSKQLAVMMYKIMINRAPSYLTNMFENITSVHSHNLRNSEYNVYVPRPYTEAGKNSFHYQGAVLWNSLSRDIRCQDNVRSFKKYLNRS